jgi:hypothetical protein
MYVILAIVLGLVAGLAMGGRPRHLSDRSFRMLWLLVGGLVLQVTVEHASLAPALGYALVLASYACLLLFAFFNLHLRGMGVVALGIVLNLAPIAVDRGMPVRAGAVIQAGVSKHPESLHLGGKRHLEGPNDTITPLGDTIPDFVFHEVLSVGDIVMSLGIAAVLAGLLTGTAKTRPTRTRPGAPATHTG